MRIRPLISKYQTYLVAFANTNLGRAFFGIKSDLSVCEITGDSISFDTGNKDENGDSIWVANVYSGSPLVEKCRLALTALSIADDSFSKIQSYIDKPGLVFPHFAGLITPQRDMPLVMMVTGNVYPDPDPEVMSVQGCTGTPDNIAPDWATLRATATVAYSGGDMICGSTRWNNHVQSLYRGFHLYFTGVLDMKSFSNVVWKFTPAYIKSDYASDDYMICLSNPLSNTNITTADHTRITFTNCLDAVLTNTGFAVGTQYSATLNTAGKNAISMTGVSKYSFHTTYDTTNTDPGTGNADEYLNIYGPNNSAKCYLEITYIPNHRGSAILSPAL